MSRKEITCINCRGTFTREEMEMIIRENGEGVMFKCRTCNTSWGKRKHLSAPVTSNCKRKCIKCGQTREERVKTWVLPRISEGELKPGITYYCNECAHEELGHPLNIPEGTIRLIDGKDTDYFEYTHVDQAEIVEKVANEHAVLIAVNNTNKAENNIGLVSVFFYRVRDAEEITAVIGLLARLEKIDTLSIHNRTPVKDMLLPDDALAFPFFRPLKSMLIKSWRLGPGLDFSALAHLECLDLQCFIEKLPPRVDKLTGLTCLRMYVAPEPLTSLMDFNLIKNLPLKELFVMFFDSVISFESVASLTDIVELHVSGCNVETVPVEITGLTKLEILSFHDNRIKSVPGGIVNMKRLHELNLLQNPLLPAEREKLKVLKNRGHYFYLGLPPP